MSESVSNLKAAFADESQANRQYLAFAKRAKEEGLPNIAKLFRAVAEAETVHAMNHLRNTNELDTTINNLTKAVSGETFEYTKMYPEYIAIARREGNIAAEWSFNVASQVEEIHARLFQQALQVLTSNTDIPALEYFVCQVCGHTIQEAAPDMCPICMAPRSQYLKVE